MNIKYVYLIATLISFLVAFFTDFEVVILGWIFHIGYFVLDKLDDIHADILKARSKR